ncbi:MAG: hypothetical protein HYX92_03525 [Chloroflexi bacterium]|nr:hypothetical protein [Chloroflexota bacterium]
MVITVTEEQIRQRIDALRMSPRLVKLREKYFAERPQVCAQRLKYAVESWRETEGQHIEMRSARKLKKILEGVPIVIHDGELTAGSQSRFFRGCAPYIDWNGAYFEKVVEGRKVTFGGPAHVGSAADEDLQICEEASRYFRGTTPAEAAQEAARMLFGDWYEDAMAARTTPLPYEQQPYLMGIPMWDKLLSAGLRSIIGEAETALQGFRESNDCDPEKVYFWRAVIIACEAVVTFAHRHAKRARELAATEEDAARRKDLEEMAEACEWVPEQPARTFHEALQCIRLTNIALFEENGRNGAHVGRLDVLLYPYLKKDMEEGRLSLERATDLLGDFITYLARLEQIKDFRGRESNQSTQISHITLGGLTKEGEDGCNDLTYLILHVLGLMRFAEPHATIRLNERTPAWIMMKSLETNRKVNGIPMYLNDKHVVEYMRARGISTEDARDWAIHGCSQPVSPPRGHYLGLAMNTAVPMDLALHNGVSAVTGKKIGLETGDPRSFETFEQFYEAYKKQHEFVIRRLLRIQRAMHLASVQRFRMPLRSALDLASIGNGKSHLVGGSDFYPLWHMKDRALVDVGDSLSAVRKLVYDDKKLSMDELLLALDSDFSGKRGEEIRQMCLAAPKYGNDDDEADYMLRDVAKFSAGVIQSEKNCFGYPYSINRNGVSWHYAAGKGIGALPNGRHARTPLTDGSLSPMNGQDRSGPTAVLNSAIKADFKESLVAIMNQKFPVTVAQDPETMQKIAALTSAFILNGGLHIQFNFVDRNVLLDAKKHPERYRDLVVRVAGYSAYFVNLTPEVQDEIISRTEQSL